MTNTIILRDILNNEYVGIKELNNGTCKSCGAKRKHVTYESGYRFEHGFLKCPDCGEELGIDTYFSSEYEGNIECWKCDCKIKAIPFKINT